MSKREEQTAFAEFAKQAGELTVDSSSALGFDPGGIRDDDRREAWETFLGDWDDVVDTLHNALLALMEAGYQPTGGAKWLA